MRTASTAKGEAAKRVNTIAAKLLTEPMRYGKPGLQAHITYGAGMTAASIRRSDATARTV